MEATRLGPGRRRRDLERMAGERFDVVVIGGGVTGCGAALDAVSRGLTVALVEQRDLASGTSSRSSKLIHGGLRYLERLDFALVREALRERGLLLGTLAPHLVWPVSFVYPLRRRVWERAYVGAGLSLYDAMASLGTENALPRHRHLTRRRLLAELPALHRERFVGGIRYHDAGTDDARFVVALARTAAGMGAAIATSTRATGFARSGRRVSGVDVRDLETGDELTVRGRVIVNATGVWSDDVERLAGDRRSHVTASKGIHLVVPRARIDASSGLITKTEQSVLFVIPFAEHWLIGTTDTPWSLDKAHPAASRADIDYLLGQVNHLLAEPIDRDDITGVFAGLRPLVSGDEASTARLSREHSITRPAPGLVTVAGGKYTTYRVMARDVIDEATSDFATQPPPSRTAEVPLHGAAGWETAGFGPHGAYLRRRFGGDASAVADLIAERPELAERLDPALPYLCAEVVWAVESEGALHLDDVLTRRTRASIEARDRGAAAAPTAAHLMAPLLGWDDAAVARELTHYRARVEAERQSQEMPDDHTADAARLGAPDVRTGGH